MDQESASECNANETIEITQNHRVHIVRVVYQNVRPVATAVEKERKKSDRPLQDEDGGAPTPEITNDNWCCATCTVIPCSCSVNGQGATSKCSSCDGFIEAQQQQQEPGPVQLEYSCRCHNDEVTVLKTVCAKCATKIHELLADILVCERRDHCSDRELSVPDHAGTDIGNNVCSNCQVVGSRIFNSRSLNNTTDTTDIPPPLPKRKFITRGAVRTPPPPKKCQVALPAKTRSSPPRRRVQRTRSADSPSDSDSSLSDSSDYPNLQYKPGVVPNEYIESDDFPTSNVENVPFDFTTLHLTDPLIRQQYSKPKSPCRAASNISPVNSSLSSMCASPASVSHSSPETVSSDDPKHSPMHTSSVSPSISSSKNTSPITLLDSATSDVGDCERQTPERRNYTIVEYHGSEADDSGTADLIDLRSPVTCSPPSDVQEQRDRDLDLDRDLDRDLDLDRDRDRDSESEFPVVLRGERVEPEEQQDSSVDDSESSGALKGAEGGACTPASFDIDFIVACDEHGVPDIGRSWPGSCDELNDDVFIQSPEVRSKEFSRQVAEKCSDLAERGDVSVLYARAHRRTGSAGGRVERADSPPPKLPLKPSLSLNQTPPPVPKRDFRTRERQIVGRPHRISRPHTTFETHSRDKPSTSSQEANLPMPDVETNRTVSQLVFGTEQTPVEAPKPVERPVEAVMTTPMVAGTSTAAAASANPAAQRKRRPLSCLLKPKHTLNKIFQKKSSKEGRDAAKPPLSTMQRELPPIPVDRRDYCASNELLDSLEYRLPEHGRTSPGLFADMPPPLLPREPIHGNLSDLQAEAQQHNFIDSLIKLREVGWYWGPLSMDKAEAKLADKKDGSFLVRDSSHDSYILSLSFRSQNRTHHTRIEFFHGTFGFWSQPSSHGRMSIVEFIEKAMEHSRNGKFLYFLRPHSPGQAPSPVVLLYPISRYERLQSLQHACRFVILKYVRYDHIDQLPLPSAIKLYLQDKHYFAEQNGDSSSE